MRAEWRLSTFYLDSQPNHLPSDWPILHNPPARLSRKWALPLARYMANDRQPTLPPVKTRGYIAAASLRVTAQLKDIASPAERLFCRRGRSPLVVLCFYV